MLFLLKYYDNLHIAISLCFILNRFALVAGDLGHLEDTFTTMSGRKVELRFYSEVGRQLIFLDIATTSLALV